MTPNTNFSYSIPKYLRGQGLVDTGARSRMRTKEQYKKERCKKCGQYMQKESKGFITVFRCYNCGICIEKKQSLPLQRRYGRVK